MPEIERWVRRRLEREHRDAVDGIEACGTAVARSWDGDRTEDGAAVRTRLRAELERAGLLGRLADVLVDVAAAVGVDLPASPVPAPPYVVVTTRGPMLRARIDPGRLVIRFDVFEIGRGPGRTPTYRGRDGVQITVSLE